MEKKKKKVEVERSNFFFGTQREIVLEGIWDLEQASCARIGVFSSSLEVQTTWFQAGGGSFRPDYYYAKSPYLLRNPLNGCCILKIEIFLSILS